MFKKISSFTRTMGSSIKDATTVDGRFSWKKSGVSALDGITGTNTAQRRLMGDMLKNGEGARDTLNRAGRTASMFNDMNPLRTAGVGGALAGGAYGAASDDTSVLGGMAMGAGLGAGGRAAYRYSAPHIKSRYEDAKKVYQKKMQNT